MGSLRKNCKTPGCPNLHKNISGYCDDCSARIQARRLQQLKDTVPDKTERKKSFREQGYTAKWTKFAKQYLLAHPVCAMCGAPAEVVDHKTIPADVMVDAYGEFIYDEEYYQPLCKRCNNWKGRRIDPKIRKQYYKDKQKLQEAEKPDELAKQ